MQTHKHEKLGFPPIGELELLFNWYVNENPDRVFALSDLKTIFAYPSWEYMLKDFVSIMLSEQYFPMFLYKILFIHNLEKCLKREINVLQ